MDAPVQATEDLIYTVDKGIARMTFNRPQARNALTFAMYEQMGSICQAMKDDHSIKAMILTGTGGDSGLLRHPDRHRDVPDRLSDCAHARQLPVDVQYLTARRAGRPGADQ